MGGDDFDYQTGEDVIRVMDMRVPLHDIRVTALVANRVQRFSFSDNVNLIAGPPRQQVSSEHLATVVSGGGGGGGFSDRADENEAQEGEGAVPGNDVD